MEGKCISSLLIVALLYALSFQSAEGCRDFICRMAKKTARECGSSNAGSIAIAPIEGETSSYSRPVYVVPCKFNRPPRYDKYINTWENQMTGPDGPIPNNDLCLPLRDYAWRLPEPGQVRYRLGGCKSGEEFKEGCIPNRENPWPYGSWPSINGNTGHYKRRRQLVCNCHSRS